jgi:hypothetical protein
MSGAGKPNKTDKERYAGLCLKDKFAAGAINKDLLLADAKPADLAPHVADAYNACEAAYVGSALLAPAALGISLDRCLVLVEYIKNGSNLSADWRRKPRDKAAAKRPRSDAPAAAASAAAPASSAAPAAAAPPAAKRRKTIS